MLTHVDAMKKNQKGFTMAELMAVVGILLVLFALAGVAIYNYSRDLKLTEYDNAAKSIYIASQNNISELLAAGEWTADPYNPVDSGDGSNAPVKWTAARTDDDGKTQGDGLAYLHVSADFAREKGFLPPGSVEETVRNNSFVIEYCFETATVYGVFYTEGTQQELNDFYQSGENIRDREVRKANNPEVGYYGGADASNVSRETLKEPKVEAGRSPLVTLTDTNWPTGMSASATSLVVTLTPGKADENDASDNQNKEEADSKAVTLVFEPASIDAGNGTYVFTNNAKVFYVDADGEPVEIEDPEGFLKIDEDVSGIKYQITLAALKSATELADAMGAFESGEEYSVSARAVSSKVLCLSAYGFGTGVWPNNEDLVFTSNLLADFETAGMPSADNGRGAEIIAYSDSRGQNGTGASKKEYSFDIENWYNDTTLSDCDVWYSIEDQFPASSLSGFAVKQGDAAVMPKSIINMDGQGNTPTSSNLHGFYLMPKQEKGKTFKSHRVFFTFDPSSVDLPKDGSDIAYSFIVRAWKAEGEFQTQQPSVTDAAQKTIVIKLRLRQAQRGLKYKVVDSPGEQYAEVVITAGETDVSNISVAASEALRGKVGIDRASRWFAESDSLKTKISRIPAGGSVSIKYFKKDPNDVIAKGSSGIEVKYDE